jgi:hypothetical protein
VNELTYVYALVRAARRPSLRGVPPPMPGAQSVRAVDAGSGCWLIVSSVPAADYREEALARGLQNLEWVGSRAVAHEAVVEHFLTAPAVLPMQMFTLFTSDARALAHVARSRPRIERILDRVAHQLEWGLRVAFDEKAARAAAAQRRVPDGSGVAYLARKRDLLHVERAQLSAAQHEADRLYRAMSREATEVRRRTATEQATPGSRLLVDAALLVPARRAAAFRSALRKNARQLAATGIVISLTGPWPPYNFITGARRPAAARRERATPKPASRPVTPGRRHPRR